MQTNYETEQLILNSLTLADAAFIFELVNTAAWIKFIGDRNIRTIGEAVSYIQRLIDNPDINYRVVRLKDQQIPVGVVTLIKRDYLKHADIGFAFLPQHTKKGYAFEATLAVLDDLLNFEDHTTIFAVTIKENSTSVQLLKKLGFTFHEEISNGDDVLQLYKVNKDELHISK